MFEGLTLEDQRKTESERGWKPHYSALTYCTSEAVIFRKTEGSRNIMDYEILVARRVTGAPDCIGKLQGKWGAYIYPTDRTAKHSIQRGLKEQFGWSIPTEHLRFAGVVGPWLHKARVEFGSTGFLHLFVTEEQAEKTPFEGKLFHVDATGLDIGAEGTYLKTTTDAKWVVLDKLVQEEGHNPDFIYWQMIAMCTGVVYDSMVRDIFYYYEPGEHLFKVSDLR